MFGFAPSLWPEPSGGVIREAMSQARPVIGSTVGGIPDLIVDGTSSLLVPPDDPLQLARAMGLLIAHPRHREHTGATARVAMGGYVANRVVRLFEALYRDVLAEARR
jgi:D-inositol-3-phosphate glycosyltransferase